MNIYLFKVICIGDTETGKTHFLESIQKRLINETFNKDNNSQPENDTHININTLSLYRNITYSVDSTIGVHFMYKLFYIRNKIIKLHFWEICGNPRFTDALNIYLDIGDSVLFFFDVNNLTSMYNIKKWIHTIDSYWNKTMKDSVDKRYKLIIANVRDNNNRIIDYNTGYLFAKSLGFHYMEFHDNKQDTHLICKSILNHVVKFNKTEYYIDDIEIKLLHDDITSGNNTLSFYTNSKSTNVYNYNEQINKNIQSLCETLKNNFIYYTYSCIFRKEIDYINFEKEEIYDFSVS